MSALCYVNTSRVESTSAATPSTTCTPVPNDHINSRYDATAEYSVENAIKNAGYIPLMRIDETLQGSVWKVSNGRNTFIIKVTNKTLHEQGVTYLYGEQTKISENIVKEKTILKYLSAYDPPHSLVKYTDFFCDKLNYFLVMEYGGSMSLFAFIKKCHEYIEQDVISIKEWHSFCKIAMKQIVNVLDWLHNTMHCCHLDISLENFVIDNVLVAQHENSKQISFEPGFQIKLIDFGVAEVFYKKTEGDEIDFECKKYVGKRAYKAPEVYCRKKKFDARRADCWSLAVVFFVMIVGCPPFIKPCMNDEGFKAIMNGCLSDLLFQWDRVDYVTSNILNLMSCLFQKEEYRASVQDIRKHPFFL